MHPLSPCNRGLRGLYLQAITNRRKTMYRFKRIKITESNKLAIVAALAQCNGKSEAHTYTTYAEIETIAFNAETKLLGLVTKKMASGAKFTSQSGKALPNAYKYTRQVTSVQIERGSSDWYLVAAHGFTAYKDAGNSRLILTLAQRDFAVHRFCTQFSVQG